MYAVMFEHIRYTQANGTVYLYEREECAVLLHRENNGVVLMGVVRQTDGVSCFGNKTPKECAHSGVMRSRMHSRALREDVLRAKASGDDYFRLELFHGLRAIFLSSRTVGRVENHPVSSWPDLSWHLRSFESFGRVERGAVPRISRFGAAFRSHCCLWFPLGTGGHPRLRAGTGESSR